MRRGPTCRSFLSPEDRLIPGGAGILPPAVCRRRQRPRDIYDVVELIPQFPGTRPAPSSHDAADGGHHTIHSLKGFDDGIRRYHSGQSTRRDIEGESLPRIY